jgi:hypothetical protein
MKMHWSGDGEETSLLDVHVALCSLVRGQAAEHSVWEEYAAVLLDPETQAFFKAKFESAGESAGESAAREPLLCDTCGGTIPEVSIRVVSMDGSSLAMNMPQRGFVRDVRRTIGQRSELHPSLMDLFLEGTEDALSDAERLENVGVGNGTVLFMLQRQGWCWTQCGTNMRLTEEASSSPNQPPSLLAEGAKVEVNWRGKNKWFKGKISHKHSDGTFTVEYNDGDVETYLDKDLIRPEGALLGPNDTWPSSADSLAKLTLHSTGLIPPSSSSPEEEVEAQTGVLGVSKVDQKGGHGHHGHGHVVTMSVTRVLELATGGELMTEGRHYWEVQLTKDPSRMYQIMVGCTRPGLRHSVTHHDSEDAYFIACNEGSLYGNGKESDTPMGEFVLGDRIGVLLDLDAGWLRFYRNGIRCGPGFTEGVTGPLVRAAELYGKGVVVTVLPGAVAPDGAGDAEEPWEEPEPESEDDCDWIT